ncbi:MAG: (2Fe-2S) ferredoxin domain-containing protein [Magnetococcales bacterium]|nr:(2Fe-2S) ferredoxin domain-containing protein [Magnetococcales bacterium]MBF0321440.1 (2Fe-2S) ferredoxin domain-containing protein [Magnetococcales bacterium]
MVKPKHHVFVCMNQRPPGHPRGSCAALGANTVRETFANELEKRNLGEQIQVTGSFCLGPCDRGPTVVVYPEGVWYGGVKPQDVAEIFDSHLLGGEPVKRLRMM